MFNMPIRKGSACRRITRPSGFTSGVVAKSDALTRKQLIN